MYLLSSLYLKGIGVEQDIEKAFYCYKAAVEKQHIEFSEELKEIYKQCLN
jgi:TPR repeat protein